LAISSRIHRRQRGCHRIRETTEYDQAQKSRNWPWKKNDRSKPRSHRKPPLIFSWLNTEMAGPTSGKIKTGPTDFPRSGQYFCGRKLIQPIIQDTATAKFRRSGSSSIRASFGALLPNWAINAWAVEASTDDVSPLSTLGGLVQSVDSATDALSPRMVRTSRRFWPRRLPCRRQLLREHRPPAGQESPEAGKSEGPVSPKAPAAPDQ
jgi:hypothetical protein